MTYTISGAAKHTITLNETDTVRSVLQNVGIIISTRRGSCPMYRQFGLPMRFLDKPLTAALPMMAAEVLEAVGEFEPRARIVTISHVLDDDIPGRVIPVVEVKIDA
jgi:hypothetical protein